MEKMVVGSGGGGVEWGAAMLAAPRGVICRSALATLVPRHPIPSRVLCSNQTLSVKS